MVHDDRILPIVSGEQPIISAITPDMISEVFNAFMVGFAPSSQVTYRYCLSVIAEDLGFPPGVPVERQPWHTMTANGLAIAMASWPGAGLAKKTVQLYVHAVRGFARALMLKGLLPAHEYLLLREMKPPKGANRVGRGRAVENQYRDQLLKDCIQDERPHGVRDAAMIATLFGSGMRRAELAGMRLENLNLEEGSVVVTVKGGDQVIKYITSWALPYLRDWVELRLEKTKLYKAPIFSKISKSGLIGPDQLTGRGVFYLLEQRCKKAGLPFLIRPHDARRTMGTMLIEEHDVLLAQKVLGHADLSTTRIYDMRAEKAIKNVMKTLK
nr:tyrosine-type recombinase/integrase [Pseudomonas aeruginosa]EIU2862369.1 tyrosine-type recombinase/integrase [Pseudomonas aeruginosa]